MSIYATQWKLKFPKEGDYTHECDWIEITAQGVPPHIGTPTKGHGYEKGDPYISFLPLAVEVDELGDAPFMRAVVFITEYTAKGTERSEQEYQSPLLVITGEEYAKMPFEDLYGKLCEALRGNRVPVIAEVFLPDETNKIIRGQHKK